MSTLEDLCDDVWNRVSIQSLWSDIFEALERMVKVECCTETTNEEHDQHEERVGLLLRPHTRRGYLQAISSCESLSWRRGHA